MLIKERDNQDADILELRRLLEYPITAKQRFLIEREIKCIDSGARGEEGSAYYIDFRWRNSKTTAIIHDLRLEYRGFVAQIAYSGPFRPLIPVASRPPIPVDPGHPFRWKSAT